MNEEQNPANLNPNLFSQSGQNSGQPQVITSKPSHQQSQKQKNKKIPRTRTLVILLLVLGLGWAAWHAKANKNNASKTVSVTCSSRAAPVQVTKSGSHKLPSGWSWYEVPDIGLKYAYPSSWGTATTQTNSGAQKYVASFTVSTSTATATVTLRPNCSDFPPTLASINNGTFDVLSGPTTTRAIVHNRSSYSSLSHWYSDSGDNNMLTSYKVTAVGSINSVSVDYTVASGYQACPADKLASNDRTECITQSIYSEIDGLINSLQAI